MNQTKGQAEGVRLSLVVGRSHLLRPHMMPWCVCPWATYSNETAHLFTVCANSNKSPGHAKATRSISQHWTLQETSQPGTHVGRTGLWPGKPSFSRCQHRCQEVATHGIPWGDLRAVTGCSYLRASWLLHQHRLCLPHLPWGKSRLSAKLCRYQDSQLVQAWARARTGCIWATVVQWLGARGSAIIPIWF